MTVTDLFHAQRAAYLQEGPPAAEVRRDRLDRLLVAVLGAADDLTEALDADFGHRPPTMSLMADVAGTIENIRHLSAHLEEWMRPAPVASSGAAGLPTAVDVVLLGVTEEMAVAREEVFGPVLTVYPYDTIADVISYVTAHPAPLLAYWYGDDTEDFRAFRHRTASGGITRNDFAVHMMLPDVPFGGIGQSGMGSYHGKAGFDTFSHRRAVAESTVPGGIAAAMGPEAVTDPATGSALRAAIAGARQEALQRLGRS
ncbi:aldehyde dehydrogenase family protein [Catenuloplanes japonicus]|uniref:aldehyde dehydrogenase family protein n=1 Tax=Catenuloplanes japonicus TaxID=33876 RepID=UPI000689C49E|nr:aldehyde dehydrogenase family protein [Catenuloplanes japonicus]